MEDIKFRAISKLKREPTFEFTLEELMRGKVSISYPGHWYFLQFTGLYDQNGKEIYKGDIVKTGEEYGEFQYDEQQSSFIILFHPHNKKQKSGCTILASTYPSPLKEVIGNIYENPELLKKK